MKRRKICIVVNLLLVVSLLIWGFGCKAPTPTPTPVPPPAPKPTAAPTPVPALPQVITMPSLGVGSVDHAIVTGLAETINRLTPMQARPLPVKTMDDQLLALKDGIGHVARIASSTTIPAALGLWTFEEPFWGGPQRLRTVFGLNLVYAGVYVRGNSGIKTIRDVKGKRVVYLTGVVGILKNMEGFLAFGNLTWDDVTKVPMAGSSDAYQGMVDGTIEVSTGGYTAAKVLEVAAKHGGAWWPPMPPEDKEGWKRMQSISPSAIPAPPIQGKVPGEYAQWVLLNYLIAYDSADENVIYQVVKAVSEGYDIFKDMHPELKESTLDTALTRPVEGMIPYHPGAIRYFKEIGRWTAEHERWQQKQIEAEKQRLEAYRAKRK